MSSSIHEALLDARFKADQAHYKRERTNNWIYGSVGLISLLAMLGLFLGILYYVFWGPWFVQFAREQHDHTVATLSRIPGEPGETVRAHMARSGYLSLIEYRRLVSFANAHAQKLREGTAVEADK